MPTQPSEITFLISSRTRYPDWGLRVNTSEGALYITVYTIGSAQKIEKMNEFYLTNQDRKLGIF